LAILLIAPDPPTAPSDTGLTVPSRACKPLGVYRRAEHTTGGWALLSSRYSVRASLSSAATKALMLSIGMTPIPNGWAAHTATFSLSL
jgi:hypothetical protein